MLPNLENLETNSIIIEAVIQKIEERPNVDKPNFETSGKDIKFVHDSFISPLLKLSFATGRPNDPLNNWGHFLDNILLAGKFLKKLEVQTNVQIENSERQINNLVKTLKKYSPILRKIQKL